METDWSREIRREYAGGDVRFELPVRPLGWGRLIGLFLIGFGLLFLWSPARDVWRTLPKWLQETPGGMPVDRLRSLRCWLDNAVGFAFEIVSCGFQAFLITDLDGRHAIWSDVDLADDLIVCACEKSKGQVVMCLNGIVNDIRGVMRLDRCEVRWHFCHSYVEFTERTKD